MSSLSAAGAVYVDNGAALDGELRIDHEVEVIWSRSPRPNKAWTHTDSAGHFHAYDLHAEGGDVYPTLVSRSQEVPCDGSCGGSCGGEGYTTTAYFCRICDEELEPGLIHGDHQVHIPGRKSWTVEVHAPVVGQYQQKVSVRVEVKDQQWFGIAAIGDRTVQGSSDGRVSGRTTLNGLGVLGRRALPKSRNVALPASDPVTRDPVGVPPST